MANKNQLLLSPPYQVERALKRLGGNLRTADRDYIYWPKRTETIKKQLQKVLEITRG